MNHDITRALLSMGYRRLLNKGHTNGLWLKPVAYVCFVFNEAEMRWYNMFVGMDDKLHCWNSHEFKPVEFAGAHVQQLKDFEYDTRTNLVPGCKSQFEFIDLITAVENLSGLQERG